LAGTVAASALSRARFFGCGDSVTGSLLRPLPLLLLLWPALATLLLLLLLLLLLPSPPLPLQLKLQLPSDSAAASLASLIPTTSPCSMSPRAAKLPSSLAWKHSVYFHSSHTRSLLHTMPWYTP
jgi:hypothetical protein